jgi:hypothetical protein
LLEGRLGQFRFQLLKAGQPEGKAVKGARKTAAGGISGATRESVKVAAVARKSKTLFK